VETKLVIRKDEKYSFFGGRAQEIEKRNKSKKQEWYQMHRKN
jgi:c-di-AMP phosphodiesterase-like protein